MCVISLKRKMNIIILYISFSLFYATYGFELNNLVNKANIYYQHTQQNNEPLELVLEQVEAVQATDDFKLIIHGYLNSRRHKAISPLANAYLARGSGNVLLADWQDVAKLDYPSSRRAVPQVALHFAMLLKNFLDKHNISYDMVHVIGHSLGAHIAAGIGQYFNGTLGRVTGLDPALPLFTPQSSDGIHATAAKFVDVIHTDFPIFGDFTPRGSVDFYPNFGQAPQPGCDGFDILTASKLLLEAYSCSHNRAVLYYAESIVLPRNFPAIPCRLSAIRDRNLNACNLNSSALMQATATQDDEHIVYMGEAVSRSSVGKYYLATNDVPPFGMGANTKRQI